MCRKEALFLREHVISSCALSLCWRVGSMIGYHVQVGHGFDVPANAEFSFTFFPLLSDYCWWPTGCYIDRRDRFDVEECDRTELVGCHQNVVWL